MVFEKFRSLPIGTIGISSITVAELQYDVMKSTYPEKNLEALQQFLTPLEIVDFDSNAAFVYGQIMASLEKSGTPIGSLDMLIVVQAKSSGFILVTNNKRISSRKWLENRKLG